MNHGGPSIHPEVKNLIGDINPAVIYEVKNKIFGQTTKWLMGLERPAGFLIDCLFMLRPYSDAGTRTKLFGQVHVVFSGGTGIGKTDLCQSLFGSIDARFARFSANPEMMPHDILGGPSWVEDETGNRKVQFNPGKIFANGVLIDESSRMQPKTKSAVLEAMEESAVTPNNQYIDEAHKVKDVIPLFPITGDINDTGAPYFFMVLFTNNPFEEEGGTYPDTRAELDRLTLTIPIERPTLEKEKMIRSRNVAGKSIERVSNLREILACAHWISENVTIHPRTDEYMTQILRNTDPDPKVTDPDSKLGRFLKEFVEFGASPRVNLHLETVARVRAFSEGDSVVRPEHVKAVVPNLILHRLFLKPGKEFQISKEEVLQHILELTELPKWI
ncbi:MAG: MoxR family ATPase [Candidatus Yanofskybacteria bacterium]|nr:MoxR family ATPase [Candidatus Yanofskybacteria bacterium]